MKLNYLIYSISLLTWAFIGGTVRASANQPFGCSVITVAEDLDWTPLLFILLGIVPIVLLRLRKQRH